MKYAEVEMKKKLKKCPFCGEKNPTLHEQSEWMPKPQREYYVMCDTCEVMTRFSVGKPKEAIKDWNRRD